LNQSTSFSECPTNQLTSYTQNQKDIDSINTSNELITYNMDEQSTLCNLSTKNIVSIFSNQLNKLKEKTTENVPNNEPILRLKVAKYGEVGNFKIMGYFMSRSCGLFNYGLNRVLKNVLP